MPDVSTSDAAFEESFLDALDQVLAAPLFAPLLPLVTNDKRERILKFITRLVEANRSLNLTAITDPAAIAAKHVGDSLTCLLVGDWPEGTSVCDVGTGGGFPGMLLAIVRPDLDVCLVDSVGKKVEFLARVARELETPVRAVHGRAEKLGRQEEFRERFDVVVARAVARLPVLAELCLPLAKRSGWFVAMKGPAGREELAESRLALRVLGGGAHEVREVTLPLDAGRRTLIAVRKEGSTPPSYPRRPGIPAKKPLL